MQLKNVINAILVRKKERRILMEHKDKSEVRDEIKNWLINNNFRLLNIDENTIIGKRKVRLIGFNISSFPDIISPAYLFEFYLHNIGDNVLIRGFFSVGGSDTSDIYLRSFGTIGMIGFQLYENMVRSLKGRQKLPTLVKFEERLTIATVSLLEVGFIILLIGVISSPLIIFNDSNLKLIPIIFCFLLLLLFIIFMILIIIEMMAFIAHRIRIRFDDYVDMIDLIEKNWNCSMITSPSFLHPHRNRLIVGGAGEGVKLERYEAVDRDFREMIGNDDGAFRYMCGNPRLYLDGTHR
jgi:hypothetical protein